MIDPQAEERVANVYLNGRLVPVAEARLPVDDHGSQYGLGFYETFRTSGGQPHQWKYHRRRLERACATVGIRMPGDFLALDERRLSSIACELLRASDRSDAVFRYTLTAGAINDADGTAPAGAEANVRFPYEHPHELLTLRPLPPPAAPEGICLRVLKLRRDSGEWWPRPKSINCANAMLGAAELRRRGAAPADEGLFLSRGDDSVVETVRQNIAWVCAGSICYPDSSCGAIAGTCLAWLLGLDGPFKPCCGKLDDLVAADAVMVMNSVRGITPVSVIRGEDDEVLAAPNSRGDPFVASLCRQWEEALAETARAR